MNMCFLFIGEAWLGVGACGGQKSYGFKFKMSQVELEIRLSSTRSKGSKGTRIFLQRSRHLKEEVSNVPTPKTVGTCRGVPFTVQH
jgi:hypothetical protein